MFIGATPCFQNDDNQNGGKRQSVSSRFRNQVESKEKGNAGIETDYQQVI
jgi:hypothetical protein